MNFTIDEKMCGYYLRAASIQGRFVLETLRYLKMSTFRTNEDTNRGGYNLTYRPVKPKLHLLRAGINKGRVLFP